MPELKSVLVPDLITLRAASAALDPDETMLKAAVVVLKNPNAPALEILIRSVGLLAPSAVVENTRRVGFDEPLQVPPSRAAATQAASA
jgi:hypothetical protein